MELDAKTVEWIIDKLKDRWDEYADGPNHSTISIGNCEHRVFVEEDLVRWLAHSMHRPYKDFLPEVKSRADLNTLPTHMRVTCSCGDFEAVEEVTPDTLHEVENSLAEKAQEHVKEATRYLLAGYDL